MHQYGSLGVPKTPKTCDALIEVFKLIRYVKNKLHVCTYSTISFTLRFVNLFVEVSRVCAATALCRPRRHALSLAKKVQILLARKSEQTELPGTRLLSMTSKKV